MNMNTVSLYLVLILATAHSKPTKIHNFGSWKLSSMSRKGHPEIVLSEALSGPVQFEHSYMLTSSADKNDLEIEKTRDVFDENRVGPVNRHKRDLSVEDLLADCQMSSICQRVLNQLGQHLRAGDLRSWKYYLDGISDTRSSLSRIDRSSGGRSNIYDVVKKASTSSEQARDGWWTGPFGKRTKEDNDEQRCLRILTNELFLPEWCAFLFRGH
ncbi:uncharacterized protein LOC117122402 [Anneissia japonica]|uniref:uncharacterized protein LOC117122402 n=1 Tax=Anneissia japonica TaxID=1529436 RepID=UPI001425B23D|nr:uncharacterized protein LOC117122402 [Anneissia japonica]XP_033123847.1 uncharacterized protein LOC117122402 [Anneissia japonica]